MCWCAGRWEEEEELQCGCHWSLLLLLWRVWAGEMDGWGERGKGEGSDGVKWEVGETGMGEVGERGMGKVGERGKWKVVER